MKNDEMVGFARVSKSMFVLTGEDDGLQKVQEGFPERCERVRGQVGVLPRDMGYAC